VWDHARTAAEIDSTINAAIDTPQPGLVGRWSLNEGVGTLVRASAGTTVDGTVLGSDWAWTAGAPFDLVVGPPTVDAPEGVTATSPNSLTIDLTWIDASDNETAFEIEKSTTGPAGPFTPAATLGANETTWSETNLNAETEYCYRVRALNPYAASPWITACGTTAAETENAVAFGGTDAYVTFGAAPELGHEQFTIETWFRRDGPGELASTGGIVAVPLVTKGTGEADGDDRDLNWFLGLSGNTLAADFEEGAAGTTPGLNHPITGVTAIADGEWHHAAATYDGTTWRLYLDGLLENELAVGEPPQAASIQHAALAAALTSTGHPEGAFDGVLDEARVWDHARTAAQISSTLNAAIDTPQPGLVGRWSLNEGVGTLVRASAGTSLDGTIQGSDWAWTGGAPFDLVPNKAPSLPTLVSPPDSAAAVPIPAPLDVVVADPDGGTLTVTFYGRQWIAARSAPPAAGRTSRVDSAQPSSPLAPLDQSWTLIGIVPDVASGDHAAIDWPGLTTMSTYEWYTDVSDGTLASTGPIWAFTTRSAPPTMQLVTPDSGQGFPLGATVSIEWTADDDVAVTEVDLWISRDGIDGTYEPVALGLPNTGSYAWDVTGPASSDTWLKGVAHDADGSTTEDVVGIVLGGGATGAPLGMLPDAFALRTLSRQPLRGHGIFAMALPREAPVRLELFDVSGRRIATLADGTYTAGVHAVPWDGRTERGRAPAGVYFLRFRTPDRDLVRKVVLVR